MKELQIQDYGAFVVGQYDQELRKVRTALGDEKAQLLDDLVSCLNQIRAQSGLPAIYILPA